MVDHDAIAAAMARAQRYAAEARAESEGDLARIRRENPILARTVDDLQSMFGNGTKVRFIAEPERMIRLGLTVEERAKRDGGIGVSVPASVPIKRKRRRSGSR